MVYNNLKNDLWSIDISNDPQSPEIVTIFYLFITIHLSLCWGVGCTIDIRFDCKKYKQENKLFNINLVSGSRNQFELPVIGNTAQTSPDLWGCRQELIRKRSLSEQVFFEIFLSLAPFGRLDKHKASPWCPKCFFLHKVSSIVVDSIKTIKLNYHGRSIKKKTVSYALFFSSNQPRFNLAHKCGSSLIIIIQIPKLTWPCTRHIYEIFLKYYSKPIVYLSIKLFLILNNTNNPYINYIFLI